MKRLLKKIILPERSRQQLKSFFKRFFTSFQWSFSRYTQLYFYFSHVSLVMKQKKNLADAAVFPARLPVFHAGPFLLLVFLFYGFLLLLHQEIELVIFIPLIILLVAYFLFDRFHHHFNTLSANLSRGMQLSEAIKHSGSTLFPPFVLSMVSWGEETGRLPEAVDTIKDYLKFKINHLNKREVIYRNYLFILTLLVFLVATVFYYSFVQPDFDNVLEAYFDKGMVTPVVIIPFLGEITLQAILTQQQVFFESVQVLMTMAIVLFIIGKCLRGYLYYRVNRTRIRKKFYMLVSLLIAPLGLIFAFVRQVEGALPLLVYALLAVICFLIFLPLMSFILTQMAALLVRTPFLCKMLPRSWKKDLTRRMLLLLSRLREMDYSLPELFHIGGKHSASIILQQASLKWEDMATNGIPVEEIIQHPLWYVPDRHTVQEVLQGNKDEEVNVPAYSERVVPPLVLYLLHAFNIVCILQMAVPLICIMSALVYTASINTG